VLIKPLEKSIEEETIERDRLIVPSIDLYFDILGFFNQFCDDVPAHLPQERINIVTRMQEAKKQKKKMEDSLAVPPNWVPKSTGDWHFKDN